MANKDSTTNDDVAMKTYSQLINMGFDENISLFAANKYPNDLNSAIEYLSKQQNKDKTIKIQETDHETMNTQETNSQKPRNNTNRDCKSIESCSSLNRLIKVLKFYKNNNNNNKILTENIMIHKKCILNDYHHILDHHLNEDKLTSTESNLSFDAIYSQICGNNLSCDISKCNIYLRNNREREKQTISSDIDKELSVYIDLLDSIHCYFIHSVDNGFRILKETHDIINDDQNEQKNNGSFDKELYELRSYLCSKRKNLTEIRGMNRFSNNKFMTEIISGKENKTNNEFEAKKNDDNKSDDGFPTDRDGLKKLRVRQLKQYLKSKGIEKYDCIEKSDLIDLILNVQQENQFKDINDDDDAKDDANDGDIQYSFGQRYTYWNNTKDRYYIIQKYSSLKFELLSNKIYTIDMEIFDAAYKKALLLTENSEKIKALKSDVEPGSTLYGIEEGSTLTAWHVLSVVLYTDYDTLSYKFSQTFRKSNKKESDEEAKQRNREYWHWSRLLCEAVNAFGIQMENSKLKSFYHGVSFIYFNEFITTFNSPTSTTGKLQIAAIFSKNDGIILELMESNDGSGLSAYLKYFNTSIISCYAYEDERLFIAPPLSSGYYLKFASIRNMKTNENYKDTIYAMSNFASIIGSKYLLRGEGTGNYRKMAKESTNLINSMISFAVNGDDTFNVPEYIKQLFGKWRKGISDIEVYIETLLFRGAAIKIRSKNVQRLLLMKTINILFPNITNIRCREMQKISAELMDELYIMVEEINKLEWSKLSKIQLDRIKTTDTPLLSKYKTYFELNLEWSFYTEEYEWDYIDIHLTRKTQ